ncbi:MAG: Ldh family oxidoreductase [Chloroflexota bacterium]
MAAGTEAPPLDVSADVLRAYTRDIFAAAGTPADVAERLAGSLVNANQSGHDSHGVIRIPQYISSIRDGAVVADARPTVTMDGPSFVIVDGNWGFGQETARYAMNQAVERAKKNGVGMAATLKTNHIGRLGEWAELAASQGTVGMVTVAIAGSRGISVAPFGGAGRALSTNPIAIGVPRGDQPPMLLDFATSIVAEGKVRFARDKGVDLPPGCVRDKDGNPTVDPKDFYDGGTLQPFGGHKGYALAMMVEVLSIAFSGADGPDASTKTGMYSGSWFLAMDPSKTRPDGGFVESVERLTSRVLAVKPAPGFDRVMLPGEPEIATRAARAKAVSVPAATWRDIGAEAEKLGVATPKV